METASRAEARQLALELRGRIREAVVSPHANHVVQKVIAIMPIVLVQFIEEELHGLGPALARHGYGCRVLCRFLEHSEPDKRPTPLLADVLRDASGLCRHNFGHHVLEAVLEHGPPCQQHFIAAVLRERMRAGELNRHAHCVLAKALTYCHEEDRRLLSEQLLKDPPSLVALASRPCGANVLRALMRDPGPGSQMLSELLEHARPQLLVTKPGRQLLRELGADSST